MAFLARVFIRLLACSMLANIVVYVCWRKWTVSFEQPKPSKTCLMNTFVHDNDETMFYIDRSQGRWGKKYAMCSAGYLTSHEVIKVEYLKTAEESYLIQLDPDYIFKREKLNSNDIDSSLKCDLQLFDKRMNAGDYLDYLTYANVSSVEVRLSEIRFLEFKVAKSGFYFIECWLLTADASNKSVFTEVLSILPQNMRHLMDANRPSRHRTERLKRKKLKKLSDKNSETLISADYEKCDKIEGGELPDKMSVLIIVLDSVSYPFLKRSFPLTYKYLVDDLENNLMFENLNIVGENTYPNMIPMLTGVLKETNDELGIKDETPFFRNTLKCSTYHDLYPFVWYDYERLGYLTVYQEDKPEHSTFRYLKKGFR
jgi:hypothetical protein